MLTPLFLKGRPARFSCLIGEWLALFTLPNCGVFQPPRSTLETGFPMPPQARLPYPDLDCSNHAQSFQRRFDEGPLSAKELACLFFLPLDYVSRQRQKHQKIPNGGDASHNAAMNGCLFWIRIYSCLEADGDYVQL